MRYTSIQSARHCITKSNSSRFRRNTSTWRCKTTHCIIRSNGLRTLTSSSLYTTSQEQPSTSRSLLKSRTSKGLEKSTWSSRWSIAQSCGQRSNRMASLPKFLVRLICLHRRRTAGISTSDWVILPCPNSYKSAKKNKMLWKFSFKNGMLKTS